MLEWSVLQQQLHIFSRRVIGQDKAKILQRIAINKKDDEIFGDYLDCQALVHLLNGKKMFPNDQSANMISLI